MARMLSDQSGAVPEDFISDPSAAGHGRVSACITLVWFFRGYCSFAPSGLANMLREPHGLHRGLFFRRDAAFAEVSRNATEYTNKAARRTQGHFARGGALL